MKYKTKTKYVTCYTLHATNSKGFVILFTVVVSSIILAITLSVADILYKEMKFSTSAKDTNEAFFSADTGAECALYYDRTDPLKNAFSGSAGPNISCAGDSITISGASPLWNFVISGLGYTGQGCAKISVDKSNSPLTTVISKGYNDGGSPCIPGENSVERQLELTY